MSRLLVIALRVLLVLLFAGAVAAQVFGTALVDAVLDGPAVTVVAVLTIAGFVGIELVLVCVWALVGLARDGQIFEAGHRSDRWVDTAIGALVVGAALATAGLVYLVIAGEVGTPEGATVAVIAAAIAGVAVALALLVAIMRHLLHMATELHAELAEVV